MVSFVTYPVNVDALQSEILDQDFVARSHLHGQVGASVHLVICGIYSRHDVREQLINQSPSLKIQNSIQNYKEKDTLLNVSSLRVALSFIKFFR